MKTVPSGFAARRCPICDSSHGRTLLELEANAIFAANWSYRPETRETLSLTADQRFPIDECGECGFIYAALLPGDDFLEAIYEKVIDSQKARASNYLPANLAAKMDYLRTLFRLCAPGDESIRILDFGCGFGPALKLANAAPSIDAIGYETSQARLAELREEGLLASGDIEEIRSRAPFSAVILDNVLEHIAQPRDTLRLIKTMAAPGTVLFVSVPNLDRHNIAGQTHLVRENRPVSMDINPWEHLNYFDLAHLDRLLAEFSFVPYTQRELPAEVGIGLRPIQSGIGRIKNGLASIGRLASYAMTGDTRGSVTARFYELKGTK
jgi:SAM-dependent methyltransferase